ncbi:melanoma-associated antigen E1-like, partial [Nannospalax galili]|uniref:melanoma-associated antigen E1-like n=1 Tax=Nannospalax galili TaxID=1026970 RepID=UPI000819BA68
SISAEGRRSMQPRAAEGPGTCMLLPCDERHSISLRGALGEGPSTSHMPLAAESENFNAITIMGLGTVHVALTLKPQDPM